VDALIRQRGFPWLSHDFVKHFQRKPVIGSNPGFLMDPALARRYGLQTRPNSPVPTTPSTNADPPESATPTAVPLMSRELMQRYGLLPRPGTRTSASTTSTNAASPESAIPTAVPLMSRELMQRYGLMPRRGTNAPVSTTRKDATAPPPRPATGR